MPEEIKGCNFNQIQAQGLQVISQLEPTQSKESDSTAQWQQLQYNSKKYRAEQHLEILTANETAKSRTWIIKET